MPLFRFGMYAGLVVCYWAVTLGKLFLFRYEHLWSNSLVLAEGKMNSNLCPPIRQQTF